MFNFEDFPQEEWDRIQEECEEFSVLRSQAIEAAIKNHACCHFDTAGDFLVGRWIMVAEIIDEYGARKLSVLGSPNLEPWEAVGMMRSMMVE